MENAVKSEQTIKQSNNQRKKTFKNTKNKLAIK